MLDVQLTFSHVFYMGLRHDEALISIFPIHNDTFKSHVSSIVTNTILTPISVMRTATVYKDDTRWLFFHITQYKI